MPMLTTRKVEPIAETVAEVDDALGSLEAELASFRLPAAPQPFRASNENILRDPTDAGDAPADDPRDTHFLIAAYRAC
jgi:hypothetical protein